jgi:aminopeptidase-like protein
MEKETDLFSEFQQIVQLTKGNLHILEASVPVERQMEYFNYSERVKKDGENESIEEQIQVLLSEQ